MRSILVALLSLFVLSAHAQMIEDFEESTWEWNEYASKKQEAIIKDGKMHVMSKTEEPVIVFCYAPLDIQDAFVLQCDVFVKKIDDEKEFGIVLDYQDDENYLAFMVKEGLARFEQWKEGRLVGNFNATIKLKEQKNTTVALRIDAEPERLKFSVNGMKALERRFLTLHSNGIGFKVGGKQSVDFDNLSIDQ
ncbi:MAG: hypothetical protein IJ816_00365 [Alloprevotella sp.]|nr:hypothetical protein [Alloprevotella sp.]